MRGREGGRREQWDRKGRKQPNSVCCLCLGGSVEVLFWVTLLRCDQV